MPAFPILTKVYANDDWVTPIDSFTSAIEASGENIASAIAQANHILVAESDSAAIAILNDTSGTPIDKFISVTQVHPVSGVALRVANFICKKVGVEIRDNRRVLRLSGPSKFYELTNRSLGNVYIAHRDTGTISATDLTAETCKIIPGDADYKSNDYYNGWTLETDDGYVAIVEDYFSADGHCNLAGIWQPVTNPTAGANYQIKSGAATDDVAQVMEFAPAGWSVNYAHGGASGTEDGTSFVAANESVLEGLKTIQEMSGETFWDIDTAAPTRSVRWTRTPLTSTGTFRNDVTQAAYELGTYNPIISITRKRADMDRVTRLRPYGNNKLTLASAEGEVVVPAGFSVDWDNNTITNTTAESAGATIRYGDVTWPAIKVVKNDDLPDTETTPKIAASVALFNAGIIWLTAKAEARYEYTIECISKNLIQPGRYYDIDYNGDVSITAEAYVTRVKEFVSSGGFRKTTVTLASSHHEEPKTGTGTVVSILHDFQSWARHNVSGGGLYLGAFGIPGEEVGTPGVSDHGELTGLGDVADHPGYLLVDGTRNLTGNLAASAGVTIDGTDISAHVADADAHHDEATAGDGITLSSQIVTLGTPSTLTTATSNAVTTSSHTHDITTTSDAETTPSTIIAGDADGRVRLDGLGIGVAPTGQELRVSGNIVFTGASSITTTSGTLTLQPAAGIYLLPSGGGSLYLRPDSDIIFIDNQLAFEAAGSITTAGGDLTIAPANDLLLQPTGDIILDPTGTDVLMPTDVDIATQGWVSGLLGAYWGIESATGKADFRYIYADELHVSLFSADETLVTAGDHFVTPGMGRIAADVVLPAVSGTVDIHFQDSDALGATAIFTESDFVMIRTKDTTGGGLELAMVWGQVTGYTDNADGTQHWTWTTRNLGAAVGTPTVLEGAIALGFGASGDGWWNVTTNDANGPYAQIVTWTTDPWTVGNRDYHLRLGRLDGLGLGAISAGEFGLAVGKDLSDATDDAEYILATDSQVRLNNVNLKLWDGATQTVDIASTGSVKFGSNIASASETGFYFDASTGDLRVGGLGGTLGNMFWDESLGKLSIRNNTIDVISFDGVSGDSYFAGIMEIDTSGEIRQGTGTWGVDFDGIRIYNNSSVGNFSCYNNDDEVLNISENGANISVTTAYAQYRAYTFSDTDDSELGGVYSFSSATFGERSVSLRAKSTRAGWNSSVGISASSPSGEDADVYLQATADADSGKEIEIRLHSDESTAALNYASISNSGLMMDNGLAVGSDVSFPSAAGTIIIDQGTDDNPIIQCLSTGDYSDANQGMQSAGVYFQIQKHHATSGAAQLRGAGSGYRGLVLIGSANTSEDNETTASRAPVILSGLVDDAALAGATAGNVVVMRNDETTQWILKEDGDVYINGTQNTYDYLDSDVEMVRAASLLSSDAIRTGFDDFVRYSRDDLEEAGLVSGTFVNTTGMMKLHSGALWQLHQRIAELEERLA